MHFYKVNFWLVLLVSVVCTTAAIGASEPNRLAATPGPLVLPSLAAVQPMPAASSMAVVGIQGSKPSSSESNKDEVDWITRSIAIFGAVLAFVNFCFSIWKLIRDRRLSVEDDFWFRKIVSPATIEPMLKAVAALLDKTPNTDAPAETIAKFAPEVTTEFAKLYASMHTLGLYEPSLPNLVNEKLRECEDLLTEYLVAIANNSDAQPISTLELRNQCFIQLNKALQVIKNRHLKR